MQFHNRLGEGDIREYKVNNIFPEIEISGHLNPHSNQCPAPAPPPVSTQTSSDADANDVCCDTM